MQAHGRSGTLKTHGITSSQACCPCIGTQPLCLLTLVFSLSRLLALSVDAGGSTLTASPFSLLKYFGIGLVDASKTAFILSYLRRSSWSICFTFHRGPKSIFSCSLTHQVRNRSLEILPCTARRSSLFSLRPSHQEHNIGSGSFMNTQTVSTGAFVLNESSRSTDPLHRT